MSFFSELKDFIKNILSWICLLIGFSFFFFVFGLKRVEMLGRDFFLPLPSLDSFAGQIFAIIKRDLLPEKVDLIVTGPLSAFLGHIIISFFLAFVLMLPFFFYKVIGYLLPALSKKEKKAIIQTLIPSFFLFFLGCAFSYFYLIPSTFRMLYPYAERIGAIPFFSVEEFITLVFGLIIAVGIMFLLPIFMVILSSLGIVGSGFWKNSWRYAILIFLIFSAIITPDGTGITMMLLSAPLAILYLLGIIITTRNIKKVV